MHDALAKQAKKKGLTGAQKDRYVFGAMAKQKAKKK
jgi:hypothetical protein